MLKIETKMKITTLWPQYYYYFFHSIAKQFWWYHINIFLENYRNLFKQNIVYKMITPHLPTKAEHS